MNVSNFLWLHCHGEFFRILVEKYTELNLVPILQVQRTKHESPVLECVIEHMALVSQLWELTSLLELFSNCFFYVCFIIKKAYVAQNNQPLKPPHPNRVRKAKFLMEVHQRHKCFPATPLILYTCAWALPSLGKTSVWTILEIFCDVFEGDTFHSCCRKLSFIGIMTAHSRSCGLSLLLSHPLH